MTLYYPGYSKARESVEQMSRPQLFTLLADLFGTDNCDRDLSDDDQLRAEARFQLELEWAIPPEHHRYYPDAETADGCLSGQGAAAETVELEMATTSTTTLS